MNLRRALAMSSRRAQSDPQAAEHVQEDYVHRIGRTARAGHEGSAVSLVCVDEHKLLADIEKLLQKKITRETVPGYAPDPRIAAEPVSRGRAQRPSGKRRSRGGRVAAR